MSKRFFSWLRNLKPSTVSKVLAVVAVVGLAIVAIPRDDASKAAEIVVNIDCSTMNASLAQTYIQDNVISVNVSGSGAASIINRTSCDIPVSLASYEMYDQTLGSQKLYDSTGVKTVLPGGSATLSVSVPPCMAQIDLFYGPVAQQLDNANAVGGRILGWAFSQNNGTGYHDASGNFCGQKEESILECTPRTQTLVVNKPTVFTVNILKGSQDRMLIWSAPNSTNPNQQGQNLKTFTTSWTKPGNYQVSVSSLYPGNDTSYCSVKVEDETPEKLVCSPSLQTADIMEEVKVTATGGNGTYTWFAPGSTNEFATGASKSFTTTYKTTNSTSIKVESGNQFDFCFVNITQPKTKVTIVKSGPATVTRGQEITYQLAVKNTGSVAAKNVVVYDNVTTPLTYLRATGADCKLQSSSSERGTVACTLGEVAASATKNIGLTFKVDDSAECQSVITNKAEVVFDNGDKNWSNIVSTTVNCPVPPLVCTPSFQEAMTAQTVSFSATGGTGTYTWAAPGATTVSGTGAVFSTKYASIGAKTITVTSGDKTANCFVNIKEPKTQVKVVKNGPATVTRGQEITYQLVVSNTGSVTAKNVVVEDEVNTPLNYLRATGADCKLQNSARTSRGLVTCTAGDIAANQSKTIALTFKVDDSAACQSVFTNKASATLSNGDKAISNIVSTTVNCPIPPLVCTPSFQEAMTAQTVSFSATGGTGTYTWAAPGATTVSGTGAVFSTKYASIGAKTITVTSGDKTANCFVNIKEAVTPNPQLRIEKLVRNYTHNTNYAKSTSAERNDVVEFKVTVWNSGNAVTNNLVLTDLLSSNGLLTGFSNLTVNGSTYTGDLYGNGLSFGNLNPGQTITVTYRYSVPGNSNNGGVCNTATAKSSNVSQVQDSSCVTVTVPNGNPELSFSKAAFNDTKDKDATTVVANREDFITFTLVVNNSGSKDATNFTITDDLSGVLPLADMIETGGGTLNGNILTYTNVTVPANGNVIRKFKVRVKSGLASNISYVITNTYGNTVKVTINNPVTYTAPKTGGYTNALSAIGFGGIITAGIALHRKKNIFKLIFS